MKEVKGMMTNLSSKQSFTNATQHLRVLSTATSGVCKNSYDVPSSRQVLAIHPIGKILFDEIYDFVFQVDIETSLEVVRQREKSHNSALMYHAVVENFFH